eukprot:5579531-Prymnesium_polylepis.1
MVKRAQGREAAAGWQAHPPAHSLARSAALSTAAIIRLVACTLSWERTSNSVLSWSCVERFLEREGCAKGWAAPHSRSPRVSLSALVGLDHESHVTG